MERNQMNRRLLRGVVGVVVAVLSLTEVATAQDATSNPEELNRKYQDALAQLKSAQDRKNELANENEKLNAKVADLEKQLEELRRQSATWSEQTWRLRAHYAAWEAFLKRSPQMLEKWKLFLESDPLAAPSELPGITPPEPTTAATATSPTTTATTTPATTRSE
jgi:predicted RNase H-like nuclease (RuvC/YqgF family)